MNVSDIVAELGLKVFCGEKGLSGEVSGGYVSDLLSDVMGNADCGEIWVTLQGHKNVMAIASLKELPAVILVSGIKPDEDTIEKANEEGIPILGTDMATFEVAGKLFKMLT